MSLALLVAVLLVGLLWSAAYGPHASARRGYWASGPLALFLLAGAIVLALWLAGVLRAF